MEKKPGKISRGRSKFFFCKLTAIMLDSSALQFVTEESHYVRQPLKQPLIQQQFNSRLLSCLKHV